MFRALLWKEWRELRLLRWCGIGVGLLVPLVLLAGAELARQGWLPFAHVRSYSAAAVLQDAVPLILAIAVWPLLALMSSAQAFAGDRAAGCEPFLLERPVQRSRVWQAKLSVAFTSAAIILVGHGLLWWALVGVWGKPGTPGGMGNSVILETSSNPMLRSALSGEMDWLASPFLLGAVAALLAFLAGMAAAAFVRTPMQAMLLGLVLALAPIGFAGLLAGLFPAVSVQRVHLAWVFSFLLLGGYVVSSFLMTCRGEPAGGGRVRRGLVSLGAAVLAVSVCFAVAAPPAMRWDARLGLGNATLIPSQSGKAALAWNSFQGAAWMIDPDSARKLKFLPPAVIDAAWSRDGSRLAVVRGSSALGAGGTPPRIELYDTAGRRIGESLACPECADLRWMRGAMRWSGEELVFQSSRGLRLFSTRTGERRTIDVGGSLFRRTLVGPTESGELHLFKAREESGGILQRVDVARAVLGPEVALEGTDRTWYARRALSPSGRFWLRPSRESTPGVVVDLDSGAELASFGRWGVWLAGDRLAWVVREPGRVALRVGDPGAGETVRSWTDGRPVLDASPDGSLLLVQVVARDSGKLVEKWIYDPRARTWLDAMTAIDRERPDQSTTQWVGHEALALNGPGFLALQNLNDPQSLHYIIGP